MAPHLASKRQLPEERLATVETMLGQAEEFGIVGGVAVGRHGTKLSKVETLDDPALLFEARAVPVGELSADAIATHLETGGDEFQSFGFAPRREIQIERRRDHDDAIAGFEVPFDVASGRVPNAPGDHLFGVAPAKLG
jgi:hypothetical protein